ncbi:MAG: T9SS type A sorting domain-containing protein [candidate division KSB1 bacterium]|nr:T9SS type A sorting domain-containing protein [candidate division KSB1 bacterium]
MKKVTWFFSLAIVCFLAPLVFAQLPDPVGHWPFDEGEGNVAADVSGNGNDGLIWSDGVFWSTDTPTGKGYSLEFAGKLGAVHIGDPDILKIVGYITLAAWIKTGPATENWQNIIVKGHGDNEIVLRIDGNHTVAPAAHPGTKIFCGSYYNGADHMVTSDTLTESQFNTWIHVVGTYSSSDQAWTLYLNGELAVVFPDPVGAVAVNRGWAIGARASANGTYPSERHFEGFIDDVRIYDVALEEDEVANLYKSLTAVESQSTTVPANFALGQNYPNPFNPITRIAYALKVNGKVRLSVYDLMGKEVAVLVDGIQSAGNHEVQFSGANLTSGIYFYKLQSADQVITKKMMLVK